MGHTVEELVVHFARATSSSTAASEEVTQLVDETKEPEDAAKGIVGLCKLVNNTSKVNSSICARPAKVCMTSGGVKRCHSHQLERLRHGRVRITCSNDMYFLK